MENNEFDKLSGTYWYVPRPFLPAMQFDPDTAEAALVVDQTVWYIAQCKYGYVWGNCYAMMTREGGVQYAPARYIVGSVAPWGDVLFTFVQQGGATASPSTVTGTGRLIQRDGKWAFQMQMSSGIGATTVHWAEMWQTVEGDDAWEDLPGTGGQSMEEFISKFAPQDGV